MGNSIPHLPHVICIPRICISFDLALVIQKSPVMGNPHLCLIETDDALYSPVYWEVFWIMKVELICKSNCRSELRIDPKRLSEKEVCSNSDKFTERPQL